MPLATSSTQRSTSHGDQTRRALVGAAVERFGRDGLRATSIASISRQAGLGPTTVFTHYANKQALFLAAVEHDMNALLEEMFVAVEASSPDPAWFASMMTALQAGLPRHPLAARLLGGLEPDAARTLLDGESMDRARTAVAARLEVSRQRGNLREEVDTARAADGILAIVLGVTMTRHQFGDGMEELHRGVGHILQMLFEQWQGTG